MKLIWKRKLVLDTNFFLLLFFMFLYIVYYLLIREMKTCYLMAKRQWNVSMRIFQSTRIMSVKARTTPEKPVHFFIKENI